MTSAVVSIQSRECSPALLERLSGSALFPERSLGAAIVSVVRRGGGSLLYVSAPAVVDAEAQVEYYLGLLPGASAGRVEIAGINDTSARWLSDKVLDPGNAEAKALREQIRAFVALERASGAVLRLDYFEPSRNLERFAEALGVRGDQADAATIPLGTKAAGRRLFAEVGIPLIPGTPEAGSVPELIRLITDLVDDGHRRIVVKLSSTDFGAGMGNALLDLTRADLPADRDDREAAVAAALPSADLVDGKLTWDDYAAMVATSGAVAERWMEGEEVRSPSFQGRIDAAGTVSAVSTHEQVLGGAGLTYVGSAFPADPAYRAEVIRHGVAIGARLAEEGVRDGDYGVDFLAVHEGPSWDVVAVELNLRATGTKHGFTMVTALLDTAPGEDGTLAVDGSPRVYDASDSIAHPSLIGLRPAAVIDAVRGSDLHFDPVARAGVVLHMLSALPTYGKFGAVAIGRDRAKTAQMMADLRMLVGIPPQP